MVTNGIDIDVLAIISGFIMTIVWLVRLEAKVLSIEADKNSLTMKLDAVQTTLTTISNSLARLEGRLEGKLHE